MHISIKPLIIGFSLLALGGCNKQEKPKVKVADEPVSQFAAVAASKVDWAVANLNAPLPATLESCAAFAVNNSVSKAFIQMAMAHEALRVAGVAEFAGTPKIMRWEPADYLAISRRLDDGTKNCTPVMRVAKPAELDALAAAQNIEQIRDYVFAAAGQIGMALSAHKAEGKILDHNACTEARFYKMSVDTSLTYAVASNKFDQYSQQFDKLQAGFKVACN